MANTVVRLTVGVFLAFTVISQASAQSQSCSLRQENEECAKRSDCCNRCCVSGTCAEPGRCFATCDSKKVASGVVAADICNITLLYVELMDTSEDVTDDFLYQLQTLIEKIIPIAKEGMKNPMSLMFNFQRLVKAFQESMTYITSSRGNVEEQVNLVIQIIEYVLKLLSDIQKTITDN